MVICISITQIDLDRLLQLSGATTQLVGNHPTQHVGRGVRDHECRGQVILSLRSKDTHSEDVNFELIIQLRAMCDQGFFEIVQLSDLSQSTNGIAQAQSFAE